MISDSLAKSILKALFGVCLVLAGVWLGRLTGDVKTIVRYEPGKVVRDTVPVPTQPDTVFYRDVVYLPTRPDTVFKDGETQIVIVVDTPAVFKDYAAEKHYSFNLFDTQEHGRLDIQQVLRYNALQAVNYTYQPVTRVEERIKERKFRPFISGSYISLPEGNYGGVGGGAFLGNMGIEYQYLLNSRDRGHYIGMKIAF